jgi:ATP-dependent helicase/nuclease subunit A
VTEHAAMDAQARSAAVNDAGSILVQAPAGSGKTTLLVQRYLRLLSRVDVPEGILALTFTRRAAQEMRERVLEALRAARLGERPAHIDTGTWDLASNAVRHLSRLNLDVEAQPGRLRIETIDAFNAWLAAQLPITAGAAGLSVLPDARQCYAEAARRTLSHEGADVFGAAVERVLALDDQRWRALVKLIAEMLPSRDRWLPLLAGRLQAAAALDAGQLLALRQRFDEDLRLLVGRVIQRAHQTLGGELLSALAPVLTRAANRDPLEVPHLKPWRNDSAPLRDDVADAARWRALADALLTAANKVRRTVTKSDGFPSKCADKPAMLDILRKLGVEPRYRHVLREIKVLPGIAYSDSQWERVREVAQVLVLAAAQLDTVFREQGAVDFTAISLAALRALGSGAAPSDLALKLDYRLQHILVDEFQDTSSAQLELLRLLTAGWQEGDGRSVFCVGDPMQSIYGFRQAEVRAFLELADLGLGDVHFDLQRLQSNFRSAPLLVEWINDCFTRIMPSRDDRDRGAIAFHPSIAAKSSSADGAVELRAFGSAQQEAAGIAATLAAVQAAHSQWRIAVLVRAKSHARELAMALRARGLAFRAVQIEPLQDRGLIRDLIMLTRALLHLGDRIAWLALLRAPWAGLTLADLMVLAPAPLLWDALQDDDLLAQLSDVGRAGCGRVRQALHQAFAMRGSLTFSRWVESTWLRLGGPGCVNSEADLDLAERAFARLRELEDRDLPDCAEFNSSFEALFADQGGEARIEIMTIHKAKGLEFDMVVVPALQRHPAPNRSQLLLSHEFARAGRDGMVMAARPPVGGDPEQLFDFLRYQQRDAATLESQRLLYVACTRAKNRLLLSAAIETEEVLEDTEAQPDPKRPYAPRAGSLLALLWPTVSGRFLADAALDRTARKPLGGTDEALRGGPLWRLPPEWIPVLHSELPAESLAASQDTQEEWPQFDWASETARRVGSLVHAELQQLNPDATTIAAVRAREPQFRRWLAARGIPAERLQPAAERAMAALLSVMEDPRARWILKRGYQDDFREHALSGQGEGSVVHAVFDRSFVEAGIRWVIDYKTSQHLGGGLAEFLDREVERYRPQMHRYALIAQKMGPEPVKLGLYFPLMKAWREWSG